MRQALHFSIVQAPHTHVHGSGSFVRVFVMNEQDLFVGGLGGLLSGSRSTSVAAQALPCPRRGGGGPWGWMGRWVGGELSTHTHACILGRGTFFPEQIGNAS